MKFGVREICDVVLRAKANQKIGNKIFYKHEPVIYFDTLKTSSMEGAATTVYAQGGRGNSRLVAWEGERTITFTMEDALISPVGFMILSGAGLIEADSGKLSSTPVNKTRYGEYNAVSKVININGSLKPFDVDSNVEVKRIFDGVNWYNVKDEDVSLDTDGDGIVSSISIESTDIQKALEEIEEVLIEYIDGEVRAVQTGDSLKVHCVEKIALKSEDIEDKTLFLGEVPYIPAGVEDSEDYIYVMILDSEEEIQTEPYIFTVKDGKEIKLKRDAEDFWGKVKIGNVVLVDYYTEKTSGAQQIDITPDKFGGNYYLEASTLFRTPDGTDLPAEFIIPNCKIQSNFTFTMASSGDPSSFTFTMDAFPDYTRFNPTKKVLAAIQIIDDGAGENSLKRESTKSLHVENPTTGAIVKNL